MLARLIAWCVPADALRWGARGGSARHMTKTWWWEDHDAWFERLLGDIDRVNAVLHAEFVAEGRLA
jgi:hypothetical protein